MGWEWGVGGWDGKALLPSTDPQPTTRTITHNKHSFFTPEARPLNVYAADLAKRQPGQVLHEQPGCLHAGMGAFCGFVSFGG